MNTLYEMIQHQLDQRIIYKDDADAVQRIDEKINALIAMSIEHHYFD